MNIRLCYASQRDRDRPDLLEDLQDILLFARNFNSQHDISGVLYYADHYFFQCLEGEETCVKELFASISKDQRHFNVLYLGSSEIEHPEFKNWSMKYVQKDSQVKQFFTTLGYEKFLPLTLKEQDIPDFLKTLLHAQETIIKSTTRVGLNNRGINNMF